MERREKKRGISLLSLIGIILGIILFIIIVKNIPKDIFNQKEEQVQKEDIKEKFSLTMLREKGIDKNSTIEDIKKVFNNITQSNSYVETSTGNNMDTYTAEGATIYFKNNKIYILIVDAPNFEFNGIKVGDSKDKVINSFYEEKNNKDVISSDGTTIIGQFLYGEYTIYDLKSKNITQEVNYGYIGNDNTKVDGVCDYIIQYVCMEPPYKNEYASLSDDIAIIEFGMKEDKVATIALQISPLEQ